MAIGESVGVHGAGIDFFHRKDKGVEPFLARPLVDAEIALVFAGECIAVRIFQQAAGTDDYGALPVVIQDVPEFLLDILRKIPVHYFFPDGLGR